MSKTVQKLYDNFAKFSKVEIPKHDEASRPTRYGKNKPHNNSYLKHVNNVNSDGCGLTENWEKNFGSPPLEWNERASNRRRDQYNQRGRM
jgi:hypothetical protein